MPLPHGAKLLCYVDDYIGPTHTQRAQNLLTAIITKVQGTWLKA